MAAKGDDGSKAGGNASDKNNSLEDFISSELERQKLNRGPGENIDEEKLNKFLSKATSESKRMDREVAKSQAKLGKLHAELGKEKMASWQAEHSSEVLREIGHQSCQPREMHQAFHPHDMK